MVVLGFHTKSLKMMRHASCSVDAHMQKLPLRAALPALLLMLFFSSTASAAQINWTGTGQGAWATFSLAGDPLGTPFSDFVGELLWSWTPGGPSFYTYCVDATQYLNGQQTVDVISTNTLTTPTGGADAGRRDAWLFNQFAVSAHNDATGILAAGLQIAIWKALYDTDGNLSTGNFQLVTTGAIRTAASNDLAALFSNTGGSTPYYTSETTLLETASGQDQITGGSPVPEPTSMLLLGSGAFMAYVRQRRRRQSGEVA
jgi:hypothetical protein